MIGITNWLRRIAIASEISRNHRKVLGQLGRNAVPNNVCLWVTVQEQQRGACPAHNGGDRLSRGDGAIQKCFKPLAEWQAVATDVRGRALPCGHYIPEESPDELLAQVLPFLLEA